MPQQRPTEAFLAHSNPSSHCGALHVAAPQHSGIDTQTSPSLAREESEMKPLSSCWETTVSKIMRIQLQKVLSECFYKFWYSKRRCFIEIDIYIFFAENITYLIGV